MADSIKQRLRYINALGAAFIVTALAGTVAFGIVPMIRSGNGDIRETARLTSQIQDLDALNVKLARAEVDKSAAEQRLRLDEALLPNSNGMNQFVQELARVAEDAGLQVDGVIPSRELKEAGAYKLMSVQVCGRADWDTCYRFLTGLRAANRKLTRLDSISLEALKDKGNLCKIDIQVSTLIAR